MQIFKSKIDEIGQKVTNCIFCLKCKEEGGTNYDRASGIIPRCLFFEERKENKEIVIAIGQNPGLSGKNEREELANIHNYSVVKEFFNTKYKGHPFYKRATNLIETLGLNGHILWTELAKCEGKHIINETLAFCASNYLVEELEHAKKNYKKVTIIALGKRTYNSLIFLFPNQKILGVPHPTGSWGTKVVGKPLNRNMNEFLNGTKKHQYFTFPKSNA
jgi:hypothetical protein